MNFLPLTPVLTTVVTNVGGTALPRSVVRFPDCSTGASVVINCRSVCCEGVSCVGAR